MGGPASGRWWRRGRDQAQADAREAAGRAAPLLIDIDRLQSEAADGVRMVQAVEPGPQAQRVAADWAPVQEQANQAVAQYMAAVAIADLDADLEEPVARHAAQAFHAASDQMGHATVAIQRFLQASARPLQQARSAHAAVPERLQVARVALTTATRKVEQAQGAGFQAREAIELVEQAAAALGQLDAGVEALGLPRMLDGAARVIDLSTGAAADAESLPGRAGELARKLTAARTLLQVTESHLAGVPEALSELRRSFVYPSFADVESVPDRATAALAAAREQLARAEQLVAGQEQRWAEAQQAITAARESIDTAGKAAQSAAHRLSALQEAQRDPRPALAQARRVVRDAQRFLLAGPEPPAPHLVSRLNALGAQLDTAPERLAARNRPDFWAYLTELDAVKHTARAAVEEIRQARAAR